MFDKLEIKRGCHDMDQTASGSDSAFAAGIASQFRNRRWNCPTLSFTLVGMPRRLRCARPVKSCNL